MKICESCKSRWVCIDYEAILCGFIAPIMECRDYKKEGVYNE